MDNLLARYPGQIFLHPQFDINKGHSCPDFVVLNIKEREVWVVEVSTVYDCKSLAAKVRDKDHQ